jgi:hypothetical protein
MSAELAIDRHENLIQLPDSQGRGHNSAPQYRHEATRWLSVVDAMDPGLERLSWSTVATKMKGRDAMPTFGASAQRVLSGVRRGKTKPIILVALAILAAEPSTIAATRSPGPAPWRSAQATSSPQPPASQPSSQPTAAPSSAKPAAATPSPQPNAAAPPAQPNAAAPSPPNDEKTSVPATVVDGEQLESVLGIQALSSTGDDMGRIVDIIVDRTGQIRAAIIDFGGFLGVGSRKIAVDWRSLHFDPKKAGAVVVNLTKDQLRVAPVYKPAEPVVMIGGPGAKP